MNVMHCRLLVALSLVSTVLPIPSALAQSRVNVPPEISSQIPTPKPFSLVIENNNGFILAKNQYGKIEYKTVIEDPAVEIAIDSVPDKNAVHLALRDSKKKTLWTTTVVVPESQSPSFRLLNTDGFSFSLAPRTSDPDGKNSAKGVAVLDKYNVITSFDFESSNESIRCVRNEEEFVVTQTKNGEKVREDKIPAARLSAIYEKKFTDDSSTSAETLAKRKVETLQIDNRNGYVSIYQDGVSKFRKPLVASDLSMEVDKQPDGKFASITFRDSKKNKLWETRIGDGGGADLDIKTPATNGISITLIPRNVVSSASPRSSNLQFVLGVDNVVSLLEATRTFRDSPTLKIRRERIGEQYHVTEFENEKKVREYDVAIPKP